MNVHPKCFSDNELQIRRQSDTFVELCVKKCCEETHHISASTHYSYLYYLGSLNSEEDRPGMTCTSKIIKKLLYKKFYSKKKNNKT